MRKEKYEKPVITSSKVVIFNMVASSHIEQPNIEPSGCNCGCGAGCCNSRADCKGNGVGGCNRKSVFDNSNFWQEDL